MINPGDFPQIVAALSNMFQSQQQQQPGGNPLADLFRAKAQSQVPVPRGPSIPTGPAGPTPLTAEANNPATPDPQGHVLARLGPNANMGAAPKLSNSGGMGDGMINAIKLAQGKSRWGAAAAGLGSGFKAADDADTVDYTRNRQQKLDQFGVDNLLYNQEQSRSDKLEAQTQSRRRNDITEQYYKDQNKYRESGGAGRVRDPAQIEANRMQAFGQFVRGLQAVGMSPEQIAAEVRKYRKDKWGDEGVPAAPAPTAPVVKPSTGWFNGLFGGSRPAPAVPAQPGAVPVPAAPAVAAPTAAAPRAPVRDVTQAPAAPAGMPPPNPVPSIARPQSKADYERLPSGTQYKLPDGREGTKP